MSRIPEYELDAETHLFMKTARSNFASAVKKYYFDIQEEKVLDYIRTGKKAPLRIYNIIPNDIPDLTDGEYQALLKTIIPEYEAVLRRLGKRAQTLAPSSIQISFNIADPRVSRWVLKRSGTLITGITKTTMNILRKIIADAMQKGMSTPEVTNLITDIFSSWANLVGGKQSRANLIARTEMAYAANASTLIAYDQSRVKRVQVYDDEGPNSCEKCKYIHESDNIWTLDRAMREPLQHPNCVRAFAALVEMM